MWSLRQKPPGRLAGRPSEETGLSDPARRAELWRAVLIGLAAGFLGGLFGVGGGLLIVPALVLFLAVRQAEAHATSLAAIVAMAAASAGRFALDGAVAWIPALILFAGAGGGAYLGARLVDAIPDVWLARAFVALALVASLRLGLGG